MTIPTGAPGWYRDGVTPGRLRWFDGTAWTAHTAPEPPAPPSDTPSAGAWASIQSPAEPTPWGRAGSSGAQGRAPTPTVDGARPAYGLAPRGTESLESLGPSSAVHWMLPVGRSWQSIVAGYLGLLSLAVWVLGPFAVACGIWALVRARSGGHGRGRAITGIVGGSLGILVLLAFALNAAGTA